MRTICILIFLALLVISNVYAIDDLNISGLNEAIYVHKLVKDSLKNYFSDEFNFRLDYKNFSFGMKFLAYLPKYDRFSSLSELTANKISYEWDERFLAYKTDEMSIRAGTFEETFGSGIVLRAYYDKDFDIDTRLEGLDLRLSKKSISFKALYGTLPNEDQPTKNDLASGIDCEVKLSNDLKLGTSFASIRTFQNNKYDEQDVLGLRTNLNFKSMDLTAEFANTKKYKGISKKGKAIYANLNTYINKFTITSAYKFYENFDYRINDLPSVNHSLEPLSERLNPGYDEEGLMGEIRFIPNFSNELVVNYSEGWNNNFKIRQNDLYLKIYHDFDSFSLTAEYEHLEEIDKEWEIWEKELTPSLSIDYLINQMPVLIKLEYQYIDKQHKQNTDSHYEPLLQLDFDYKGLSFSIIAEYSYKNFDNLLSQPLWLGLETYFQLFNHTDLRVFVGREKGGKVCRNGVCKYQSMFKGIRFELTTSF